MLSNHTPEVSRPWVDPFGGLARVCETEPMPSVADLVADHLLESLTDPETYELGRELANRGAVAFEAFGPLQVRAAVDDGETYVVDLRSGPGKLIWWCSEPGGSRGDFCRHCVATAMETWRQAPARALAGGGPEASTPQPPVAPERPPSKPPAALASDRGAITGVHAIVFSPAADEVRAFFRDTLGLASVDAGGGWPIFALPPAELAVHPAESAAHEIYLMCDDIGATIARLERKGVRFRGPVREESWGSITEIALPGGTSLALYQPKHPSPQIGRPRR